MHQLVKKLLGGLVVTLVLACSPVQEQTTEPVRLLSVQQALKLTPQRTVVPGRYIVVFKKDVKDVPGQSKKFADARKGKAKVNKVFKKVLNASVMELSEDDVEILQNDPSVLQIIPDEIVTINQITQTPVGSWGLDRIDQLTLPLNNAYTYKTAGLGVHVYIVDTGIRPTHVDFTGRADGAFSSVTDGNGTLDCNGHGTHVAGTIGGSAYGVAKSVRLHGVRVLDCGGSGAWSNVIAGLDWVAQNAQRPAVVNMSLGGGYYSSINTAVDNLVSLGIPVVVAAGNSAVDACTQSPASAVSAITVAASNSDDTHASYSNVGSCVDIYAPGSGIVSTWIGGDDATANLSGTSMASPHGAGAAALVLGVAPNATPSQVAGRVVQVSVANAVIGVPTNTPNKLLNINGLEDASGLPTTPPSAANKAPVAMLSVSCPSNRSTCTFNASASTDDVKVVLYEFAAGDGSPVVKTTSSTITHKYTRTGRYTIKVTVYDAQGLSSTNSKLQTIRKI